MYSQKICFAVISLWFQLTLVGNVLVKFEIFISDCHPPSYQILSSKSTGYFLSPRHNGTFKFFAPIPQLLHHQILLSWQHQETAKQTKMHSLVFYHGKMSIDIFDIHTTLWERGFLYYRHNTISQLTIKQISSSKTNLIPTLYHRIGFCQGGSRACTFQDFTRFPSDRPFQGLAVL